MLVLVPSPYGTPFGLAKHGMLLLPGLLIGSLVVWKQSILEAGAFCVDVLVLLAVIRGAEVVLVLHISECSLLGVHTFQCLKIEMGPSSVLQTNRKLQATYD